MGQPLSNELEILRLAYRDFNSRNIEAVIARMHPEVVWANGMEGGVVESYERLDELVAAEQAE